MSNAVFPVLPGLSLGATSEPMWTTEAKRSASGMEQRAGYMSYPLYRIKLSYEFLRAGAEAELQTLIGFFNQRGGDLESFLYDDASDNTATVQTFGTGDGVTTVFRLGRTLGGAYEPVSAVYGSPVIQGSNMLRYSEQIELAPWSQFVNADVDVSVDTVTSPTGTLTGDKVIEATTTSNTHQVSQVVTTSADATYTVSGYFKAAERSKFNLIFSTKSGLFPFSGFDLIAGTSNNNGAAVSSIQPVGDGWYRCVVTVNVLTGASNTTLTIQLKNDAGSGTYAGTPGSGLYAWGLQCELGSVASPYMPTGNVASSIALDVNAGTVTYTPAPPAGVPLLWSGNYYRRVRFEKGAQEFKEFLRDLWDAKSIALLTVKT